MEETRTRPGGTGALMDGHKRRIDYLRLSITDRCNLRCVYCMPRGTVTFLRHEDILRYEEILRLVRVAVGLGIRKVRITGGEPFVRKDFLHLCSQITAIEALEDVSVTTNGLLLETYAQGLWDAGVRRINVSLDTLDREKYRRITGVDGFERVWAGIMRAHQVGHFPVKINVVALKGVNDDEVESLAGLTRDYPFHVRFIEFMPFRPDAFHDRYLSGDVVLERLQRLGALLPATSKNGNGPARYYQYPGAPGKVGIISPVSHHFCPTCNRLRVTAEGRLRTCLFSEEETDLRVLLRSDASDARLAAAILEATSHKPERHQMDEAITRKCISRPMSAIGG
ncbi:cyclic pyranopterin monophosphate synthase subunit MoaA [Desulfacinum hydrothermale DSM 13146]|uniref:GTP 3',8-cyclase n=1 Tax=Desulfacinum hydrothermale DSM 13146 TaxID=1121390 RepID=A0A1W1XK74_9BACT|nr:GTP 3',8-cyclase MoaA [Desulfacinum hydrothermale]SMC24197.1 cyclic pyranopterin monophosphate synthase subunit MoaA [Desulfacinum hydrothermale DSM 13146]